MEIPFLPIQFFKTHEVLSSQNPIEQTFTSSGTTGSLTSKHFVTDLDIYKQSFRKGFQSFYGSIEDYVVLALLPSYLERDGSSLIYMTKDLIKTSKQPESGFYLNNLDELAKTLLQLEERNQKILLIVSKKTEALKLSTQNLKNIELILASNLNTLSLLKAKQIILTPLAINDIKEIYCD